MKKIDFLAPKDRSRIIDKVSIVDTLSNLVIGIIKVIIAILSRSIAVASDSVLNFGDVVAGIVTIIGTRVSEHKPTKKHPFGFGRIEYLTTITAAAVMLVIGFEFARIGIEHILHPVEIHITPFQYFILFSIVLVKFALYYYNKREGEVTQCESLTGVAHDSYIDAYGTALTVLLIFIDKFIPIDLDGWISLGVACFIMLSSLSDIYKTISLMLGEKPNKKLIEDIKKTALSVKPVEDVHNIIIHSYGYYVHYGQMDIELPDDMDIRQASKVLEKLAQVLEERYEISFTFGIWPENITYKNTLYEYRKTDKGISISKAKAMSTQQT